MTSNIANEVSQFNLAQTFFIDPGVVKNAAEISVTGFNIYFKKKPEATGNISGINNPGITFYLTGTKTNGYEEVPDSAKPIYGATARIEYSQALLSDDATVATKVTFPFPINVKTGRSYSIIVKYDGNEQYALWSSIEGNILAGTNSTTAGPAGKYIGKYYEYSFSAGESDGGTGNWKPLSTTDLKFDIFCAKFQSDSYSNTTIIDFNGQVVDNVIGTRSYMLYKDPYEFIIYDKLNSTNVQNMIGGEIIYQDDIIQIPRVAVKSGSDIVSTQTASFSQIFGNSTDNDRYIVVYSGDDLINKNVRKVAELISDTVIRVDIPLTISDGSAYFSRVAAGVIDYAAKTLAFGSYEDALVINQSNANSSVRFVNNTVESITVLAGGTGYSNTDYISFSNGGEEANASVITSANGTIISYNMTNKGYGFVETPVVNVYAANGSASNGSSANISATIGSTLKTEFSNAVFKNAKVVNAPVASMLVGAVDIENPYGTTVLFKNHYIYSSVSDGISDIAVNGGGTGYVNGTSVSLSNTVGTGASAKVLTDSSGKIIDIIMLNSGSAYTVGTTATAATGTGATLSPVIGVARADMNSTENQHEVDLFQRHKLPISNTPMIISRSYEVTQPNVSITTVTGLTVNTNISSVIEMIVSSNNVYTSADIVSGEVDVFYEKNLINNTYQNEHTGNGDALAKHVSETIEFGVNRLAEDIRVFVDAYKPVGTDIKVFSRIHNSLDPEVFSSKNWTLLELKSNNSGVYSSAGNEEDLIEFEYGFSQYPNTDITVGSVTTTANSSTLTGTGTTFSTLLEVGDVVKIYSPLFPQNYIVDVVDTITSNTSLTVKNNITNNNVIGVNMNLDKLGYKNQAFNNKINDNTVRYYNSALAAFDGYNSMAIKIVFLSNNEFIVPKAASTKAIGVTA